MHGSKILLVLENWTPTAVILGSCCRWGFLWFVSPQLLVHSLHGFKSGFPGEWVAGSGNARGCGQHTSFFSLDHGDLLSRFWSFWPLSISSPKCHPRRSHFAIILFTNLHWSPHTAFMPAVGGWWKLIQGTWWSWVRTQSSSLFPAQPCRLPFTEFRFLSRLSLFWRRIVSWSRMTTLFMDTYK